MERGRPRLADDLKKQRGTLRKGRMLPQPSEGDSGSPFQKITELPPAPDVLTGQGLMVYETIGLQICQASMLSTMDIQLLVQYCYYLGVWLEMADDVNKKGKVEEKLDYSGMYRSVIRQEWKVLMQTRTVISEIEHKIGLDPSARQKMLAGLVGEKKKNKFLA